MPDSRWSNMDKREALDRLFQTQGIDLVRGPLFDTAPALMPGDFDFGKVEAMMLGLGIGDSLGNTSEGDLPSQRRRGYGEIREYLWNPKAGGGPVGFPSDDSQLAFWTLEQMLADDGFMPDHVIARFARGQIFGIGSAVNAALVNYHEGLPWHKCGVPSSGNGALMRIAPMVIPHLRSATTDLWVDTALSAMLTHNDAGSIAACLGFVAVLWRLLTMRSVPPPGWWLESYAQLAENLEGDGKSS